MNVKLLACVPLIAVLAAACATPATEESQAATRELVAARGVTGATATTAVDTLLAEPIGVDSAAQLALLANPHARAIWAELGIADAEVFDALRISNPTLGFLQLSTGTGVTQTTWSLSQPLLDLLFIGYRRRQGEFRTLQAQQQAAGALVGLEADVRAAFVANAAAETTLQVAARAAEAAGASAELAARYHAAGNISELQLRREQAAASAAALHVAERSAAREQARSQLLNLLGLRHDDPRVRIDTRLSWDAGHGLDAAQLAVRAQQQRLDLAALRAEVELRRRELQHVSRWRFLPGLTLNAESEAETGSETLRGAGAEVTLPLFNAGAGQKARAAAQLQLREAQLAALEVAVANDTAAEAAALATRRAAVEAHARQLLEQRERIVVLTQQRFDYMLVGAFDLMAAREQQISAYEDYIDQIANLAQAQIRLERAIGGRLPVTGEPPRTLNPEDLP